MTLTEIFTKAAMNTILGMGVVFAVLIFISFIISLFKYLPGLLENRRKPRQVAPVATGAGSQAAEASPGQDPEDPVLAAVIAGAIHSYLKGSESGADEYVVRSVRRV